MRSPEARAREVAARMAAATGTEARTTETADAIRVEVEVPAEITTELLTALVTALGTADRFGHDHTSAVGVAWAEIARPPRPAADAPPPGDVPVQAPAPADDPEEGPT